LSTNTNCETKGSGEKVNDGCVEFALLVDDVDPFAVELGKWKGDAEWLMVELGEYPADEADPFIDELGGCTVVALKILEDEMVEYPLDGIESFVGYGEYKVAGADPVVADFGTFNVDESFIVEFGKKYAAWAPAPTRAKRNNIFLASHFCEICLQLKLRIILLVEKEVRCSSSRSEPSKLLLKIILGPVLLYCGLCREGMAKLKKKLKDSVTLLKFSGCANLQVTVQETNQKAALASRTAIHMSMLSLTSISTKLSGLIDSENKFDNLDRRAIYLKYLERIKRKCVSITPEFQTIWYREVPPTQNMNSTAPHGMKESYTNKYGVECHITPQWEIRSTQQQWNYRKYSDTTPPKLKHLDASRNWKGVP
jgi:hypothetical protein